MCYTGLLLSLLLLTASALQITQRSGSIGHDVQLVCVQTVQDHEYSALDCVNSTCTLDWFFGNKSISPSAKYSLSNTTSSNYCNLTPYSTQLYQALNFTSVRRNHVCEVHSLTIAAFNSSDIGLYSCNYTYNATLSNLYSYAYFDDAYYPDSYLPNSNTVATNGMRAIQSVMTITGTPNQTVVYAERKYQDPITDDDRSDYGSPDYGSPVYERMLTHCVASGGNITWLARACVEARDPYNYYVTSFDKCGQYPLVTLEEFLKADQWRCFELTTLYSYPYQNVTESMLGVKRVCPSDNFQILCTVGEYRGNTKSKELNIQKEGYFESSNQRYWNSSVGDGYALAFGIIFLVLVTVIGFASLLFAFIILAVCRCK